MTKMQKKIMVVMLILVSSLLIAMSFEVKATGDGNPIDLNGNLDLTLEGEENTTEPDLNTLVNEEENTTVIQPDTNTANITNTNETLPKAGVTEDITVMFFIVVCAVSAIYAYKKIRDYKV